jgi:hypothetical protein
MPEHGLCVRWFAFVGVISITRDCGALIEHHPHGLQGSSEGIENEAEVFKRDDGKECVVAGFAKNDGSVAIILGERNVAFGTWRSMVVPSASVKRAERLGVSPIESHTSCGSNV